MCKLLVYPQISVLGKPSGRKCNPWLDEANEPDNSAESGRKNERAPSVPALARGFGSVVSVPLPWAYLQPTKIPIMCYLFLQSRYVTCRLIVLPSLSVGAHEELQCYRDATLTNAKVAARAVIQVQNRILFTEYEGGKYVYIPGGGLEAGEVPTDTLHREMMEEFGSSIVIERFLGCVYYNPQKWNLILGPTARLELMFECSLQNNELEMPNHIWLSQTQFVARDVAPFMIQFLEFYLAGVPTTHLVE